MAIRDAFGYLGNTTESGFSKRISDGVLELLASIPSSAQQASSLPLTTASALRKSAARKAAGISGSAALIPGPLGFATLVPEVIGIWKLQAQLVADIAAAFGKTSTLSDEQMLYCMFRHLLSQGLRDIVVRVGERYFVRRASLQLMRKIAMTVGVKVSQRAMSKAVIRFAPGIGAAGVAAYAYYDTNKVALTAIELFSAEIEVEL